MPDLLKSAKALCQELRAHGFIAYFAGGYVRDLLLGILSLDIDIATNATPDQITSLFPKTIDVGKSFGVIVVIYQGFNFEVSTFRKDREYKDGRHPVGVDFSSPEEDALRRDFTINGLFQDPTTDEILDFVGGKKDLEKGLIRAIGNAQERFEEDKLRMIRAVRFSVRFGFPIEKETEKAIFEKAKELFYSVSIERIWQELEKMQKDKALVSGLLLLEKLTLLQTFLPHLYTYQELETLLKPALEFPVDAPILCTILLLFTHAPLEEKQELFIRFKLSRKMEELIVFFHNSDLLFKEERSLYDWAYFYAHPLSSLYLECKKTCLTQEEREKFTFENCEKKEKLELHIKRIQNKTPLVKAKDLEKIGVKPSKQMGVLLKRAEKIAINENLQTKEEVLEKLKIYL